MSVDTFWKGEVRVQGQIEDETKVYQTRIFIKGSQIYDYSCSCAEGNSFRGPCVHAKALQEAFARQQKAEHTLPVSTSPEIRMMIREYTNREVARILGEEEREPVYLHPYLQIRRGEVLLEARIGREKRYIVKNLLEFAQAVHSGKRVEYGKGMAFEHVPSAFAPESRPFLDLLLEEADAYIRHYEGMRGHAGLPLPVMRALTLGSAARDRLFDLLEGKEVQTEDEKGAERVKKYSTPMAAGLTYNYAAKQVDETVLDALAKLADEAELIDKFQELYNGAVINTGEKRMVLHHLARTQLGEDVVVDGVNKREFYVAQQKKAADFANKVHAGEITNENGEKFTTVVQIGIGGSDLGPRALYIALENWAKANNTSKMEAKFISNVDPDDAAAVLASVDLAHALFIVVSKSGTTLETLTNEAFVKNALVKAGLNPSKHMLAVTSETSPLAKSEDYLTAIFMDDYIGGRYSSVSGVGGAILSLAFGPEVFAQILDGAAAEDKLATNKNILENPDMLDALIGVYERNVQGYPATAVLPYSQALSRFPAHLQQCDMESNGKSVNRFGEPVDYVTGPVIFGEPGTNGQHSFYQLLHQGTDIVPLQFIGFKKSQLGVDVDIENSTSQQKLCANVAAQIVAFACGKKDENLNKNFKGGRPSSIITGEELTPASLGALLAHFENKIMFQGFVWNLNSFDQEGVQLGKVLAKRVLAHETDGALKVFSDLLNI